MRPLSWQTARDREWDRQKKQAERIKELEADLGNEANAYERAEAENERLRELLSEAEARLMLVEGNARYIDGNVELALRIQKALARPDGGSG